MTTRRQFVRFSSAAGLATVCGRVFAQAAPVAPIAPVAPVAPVAPLPSTPVAPTAPDATTTTPAPAGPLVSETEPQAVAVGYVEQASRADRLRFPAYRPGQHCGNCQRFEGASNAPKAPCALLGHREVQGPGWCSGHQLRVG